MILKFFVRMQNYDISSIYAK